MSGSGMVANGDEASANPGVTRRREPELTYLQES